MAEQNEKITELNEVITEQALKISQQTKENKRYLKALNEIYLSLICIGEPLNDNFHQYDKQQLKLFFEIKEIIEVSGADRKGGR